jgi:membrane protein YdbS with pleckstrin-like domain
MNDEKKKITVTHVNIRLSISMLLLKLILIELFAGTIMILWHSILAFYISNLSLLHSLILYDLPILFFLVLIKLFITVFLILQWLNEYYEISAEIIKYRRGIIFRRVDDYPIADIKYLEIQQGVFGRLLNFGTISLLNIRRVQYAQMYLIHNPMRYSQVIEELVPNLVERKKMLRRHFHESENEEKEVIDEKL